MRKYLLTILVSIAFLISIDVSSAKTDVNTRAELRQAIYNKFGSGYTGQKMFCIANNESKLNPRAENKTDSHYDGRLGYYIKGSFGLFQIGALHRNDNETVEQFRIRMFNPIQNINIAYKLYKASGFYPWTGRYGC